MLFRDFGICLQNLIAALKAIFSDAVEIKNAPLNIYPLFKRGFLKYFGEQNPMS